MRTRSLALLSLSLGSLALAALSLAVPAAGKPGGSYSAAKVKRGKQLVMLGGCNDCHTPWKFDPEIGMPVPDMSRMLSGHPEGAPLPQGTLGPQDLAVIGPTFTSFRMPFGVVLTPNLTPDPDTGTGSWTQEMFLGIFRKAKHLGGGGRPILPPMPWNAVASLPDEDIVAIFAYLRSIPPIRNHVDTVQPPPEVQTAIDKGNQKLLERLRKSH
jgi:hypothetical protein